MDSPQQTKLERSRSIAEIIGEALDLYQRYPLLFMLLALGVVAPFELAVLAVTGEGPLVTRSHQSAGTTVVLLLVELSLVRPLISALYVHAVTIVGEGRRPSLTQVAALGLRVLPEVAAAVIVAGIGIGIGLLALIIPGIILLLRWAVVAQVAAVEHQGWLPALRRSGELTRGNYMHILGLLVITGVLAGGLSLAASAIPLGSTSGPASVALGTAVRAVAESFTALTLALLYFDLRARRSGLAAQPVADHRPPADGE
jgi:hypothetical protein